MEGILPNTAGTSFNTTNASTLATAESSSSGSSIWDSIQNGTSSAEKSFSKGTESFKQKASEWVNKAKNFLGGN